MARRHDPVDERPALAPLEQRVGDAIEAAAEAAAARARRRRPTAEQALDAQHVGPRALREPIPQQLGRGVDALRIGRVVFAVGLGRGAVEDEVGAVVHQRGVDRRRREHPRHRPPELSARAGDQHPHRERSFVASSWCACVSQAIPGRISRNAGEGLHECTSAAAANPRVARQRVPPGQHVVPLTTGNTPMDNWFR